MTRLTPVTQVPLMDAEATRLSPVEYRRVLGHLPTGVSVLTAFATDGLPVGMAANSLTSASLDPPMVLVCPAKSSTTWPVIRAAERFCVNFLASHHEPLCRQFASKAGNRFEEVAWHARSGGPALDEAVAWLQCEIADEHEAGDHTVVIARVLELDAADERTPLVFFCGRYGTVA